ncbi:MAG TPA: sigma-70 family RNA polymerase sigma factor [Fimbriimonadaceae bacterium]|nr:sigma-70 family RNA polymerase sigma factor [Fimbriimonadaceae bacterium]
MSLALDWTRTRKGDDPMEHLDAVFRYAMARLHQREEAEDIAMEVVQALPNPCRRKELRLYMIGMARRKVADRLRRLQHGLPGIDHDASFRFDVRSDDAALVADAMQALSPDHREVLTLKYVVGLSSAEIGKVLARKPEAIDSLLQRARAAFGQAWTLLTSEEVNR